MFYSIKQLNLYMSSNPNMNVPEEHSVENWSTFLPPLKKMKLSRNYISLIIIIIIVITLFPPLPAFAIYFCLIHSFNHMKRVVPTLLNFMEKGKAISLMITLSVLSWLGGAVALYYILNLNIFPEAILKVTFIGLAALTFPHMILVDGFFRSKYKI